MLFPFFSTCLIMVCKLQGSPVFWDKQLSWMVQVLVIFI